MIDELRLLKGENLQIGNLTIKHPTLQEIMDFGEQNYYSVINLFCAKPYDFMVQLDDVGLDYEEVKEYSLFLMLYQSGQYEESLYWLTGVSDFELCMNNANNTVVLHSVSTNNIIDEYIFFQIRGYLNKLNFINIKNEFNPANKTAKKALIDRERRKQKRNMNKQPKSILKNQISALVWANSCGVNFSNVWDLYIYQLHDGIIRINKIKSYENTMNGYYFGTVDLKKLDANEINWTADL